MITIILSFLYHTIYAFFQSSTRCVCIHRQLQIDPQHPHSAVVVWAHPFVSDDDHHIVLSMCPTLQIRLKNSSTKLFPATLQKCVQIF